MQRASHLSALPGQKNTPRKFSISADIQPVTSVSTAIPSECRLRLPEDVGALLKRASVLLGAGRPAEAIDWLAAAAVADIQHHQVAFLATVAGTGYIADQYGACLEALGVLPETAPRSRKGDRTRVLYVVPALIPGNAAACRLARVLEQHDRARFEPMVLCTEEFTERTPALEAARWPDAPSSAAGRDLVDQIRASGALIEFLSTRGGYAEAIGPAIRIARSLGADIAVFIASPACPVQAAMAFARVAPIQINQNIGAALPMRGMDAVIYHNARAADPDRTELQRRGIAVHVAPSVGTDLSAAERAQALQRGQLGLPGDAVVLVSAANKLPRRMISGTFAHDLGAFLARHPGAWWLGIGRGDFAGALAHIERAGGADAARRCVNVGALADIRPALKACDIYLNEYPEGGCNTVLEAMACALPVAALHAGPAHAEHVGAELIGIETAGTTIEGYWQQVSRWLDNAERRSAGLSMRGRVEQFPSVTQSYELVYALFAAGKMQPRRRIKNHPRGQNCRGGVV